MTAVDRTPLLRPRTIQLQPLGGHRVRAVLEPFERGLGHTFGNALRRVLLSSMAGCAPTEVIVAGVAHGNTAIDGVQESRRYPGGLALRFARLKGYRTDKTAAEADTIETVRAVYRQLY